MEPRAGAWQTSNAENLPPQTLRLLCREVSLLSADPPDGIKVFPNDEDVTDVQVAIEGPEGTPYAGGLFRMKLVLGKDFPAAPPKGFFLTKIFHPNVGPSGEICVNVLKRDWRAELGLRHVLLALPLPPPPPPPRGGLSSPAMGNAKSGALSKEVLEDLKTSTRYSEEELCRWYESFQRQCPDGRISRAEFEKIYGTFFPNSDPQGYARHVFRSFDTNDDGTLDFREYIIALHLTSSGKTHLKLEWAFSLFDVDRNGEVSKSEVLEIITAIFKMIPLEEQKLLPEDENTPQKRADKLWAYFNKGENDKIAEAEFIEGVMKNDAIMRLIQYEPKK
ncbi:PREDICTED: ubiquitin-conjugating enzyme E2 S isoform X1 [Pseudopodoces humilis]|nr:PREDICTED: ubiquitin-conjugating enzyme E2 S isoform X1 [Pseudopodoces humilis]